MFKFLKEKKKDNKGFTLVELVIVIAILAILVGLLAPQYTKYVEKSRKSADVSNLDNLVEGLKVATADTEYNLVPTAEGTTADIYIIAIGDNGAVLKKNGKQVTTTDPAAMAIEEYSGIQLGGTAATEDLKLKSAKWGKEATTNVTGATSEIYATITINRNDTVTVEYSTNVDNYSKTGKIN